ncbi:DUF3883 domain-containing protein [Uliginosibacterium sp. 31-16]|uniref:DUF3883 domain-containing protein n=1 Tax=Uliginosibacterium sp. 31-16 TaxID=3068315 RepID=UPI00273D6B1C|nr:DUF3883 domain-containing protein [Uliginosibacterium sp. 31-16]MDP5238936.1 DUF3883 domain-containing protein [Uliginosibacterium sp. 31-16]
MRSGADVAKGENWSDVEVAATVADYMRMLTLELSGQHYNKTAHRRALLKLLDGRSDAAVELKHQNVSAILLKLGCYYISGYKPRGNYQQALGTFVENWINEHPEFDRIALAAADQPAVVPSAVDFSRLIVDAPKLSLVVEEARKPYVVPVRAAIKRDYVAREARNSALGKAGELLALEYEEFRLRSAGQKHLAERIEHVSTTKGDGLGYDILSFEVSGKERFVEVKTTAFAKETPFFASRNEVAFAREMSGQFHLYRLFDFRKAPRLFSLQGDIGQYCRLDPVSYLCQFQ